MSNIPTASRPTVKELDPALKGLVRWKNFAIQLPTIELSDVVEIEQNHRGSIADQRLAVYGTWLCKCVSASWLNVITALETIDENVLAEHLKVKCGLVTPHCPDDAIPQTPLLPNSSPDSYQHIPVPSEVKVVKDLEWLNECFCELLVDLRTEIDRLVESDKTLLRTIAYRIDAEECYTIKGLTAVKEPIELFDLIRPYYNFLNIYLLKAIATHKYLNSNDLCARIMEYNDSVNIFKSTTPVESLRNSIIPYVPIPNSSNPRSIVIIKLQKQWSIQSITLVERLTESLFPNNRCAFEWFRVMIGSVYIMFLVPEEKTESLIASSRQKHQYMRLMGVISLQVSSTHVLNEDENKSFSFDSALLEASQLGNNEAIQFLIDLGAGNNITSNIVVPQARHEKFAQEKLAPIFMGAIKQNNLGVVAELINKVSVSDIQLGVTAACRLGYSIIIRLLIKHLQLSPRKFNFFIASLNEDTSSLKQQLTQSGINPNTTLISDITPLMIASSCGHIEVLECLLQAEADVNSKDEDGYTPLAYAITGSKSLTIVQRLLECEVNPNILLGGISKAKEENGTEEIVNLLLKYLALKLHKDYEQLPVKVKKSINDQIEEKKLTIFQVAEKIETHFEVTSLTKAQNTHELFNKLQPYYSFLSCDILVDITKEFIGGEIENELEGYLVMMRKFQKSVKIKQLKEVMSLVPIQHDTSDTCDVNIKLNGEWEDGTLENLQQLLKHMFHNKQYLLNHMTVDERQSLCITFTIPTSQSVGIAEEVKESKEFIECVGVSRVSVGDVDVSIMEDFKFSFSSGLLRAAGNGIKEAVQFFVEMGVNIDDVGTTALMLASKGGHEEIVETLLSAGANGSQDSHSRGGQILVKRGADPNIQKKDGATALMYASQNGHSEVVQILVKGGADPNIQMADGATALIFASRDGHTEVVQILLEQGANPNIPEEDGWTTLMYACQNGHFEMVQILLKGGADPNIQQEVGATALMFASQNGYSGVVEILLKADADPNLPEEDGWTTLMYACQNGHSEVVQLLLKRGADPNIQQEVGTTALISASQNGHSEVVQILLKGGTDPNIQQEVGATALMFASQNGHSDVVQILLKGGADPNIQEKDGWTTLMYGCQNGHSEVVQILLKEGADPNIQKEDGWTTLMYGCQNGHSEVVQILLKEGADPNIQKEDGWTALMYACQYGHSEVVQILLKGGADSNIQEEEGWTTLMYACWNGYSKVVQILLKGGADPNIQEADGWTALMNACMNRHFEVVQILLKGGADPNIQNKTGWTALMSVSKNGHSKVAQILLKGGADPNIQQEAGATALMSASKNGHSEVIQILLKGGADPNIQREVGATALMSASKNGLSEVVQILLKGGADPNIQKEDGWTALMSASKNGHSEVAQILLKGGADPNIQKEDRWTALMSASKNGHSEVVQILLKGGADPNIQQEIGATALMSASKNGHFEVVQILLKGGADPNIQKEDGLTALMSASKNSHSEVVQILLKGGADPNIQKKDGWTALMSASENGHLEVVQIILNGGADPNIQKEERWTALMYACQNSHSEVVQILLKGGADPNIRTKTGWTALMSACENGHSEMVQILLKGGADPNSQKKDGKTALMYGSEKGYSNVVEVLLNGGADSKMKTKRGNKALAFAITNNHFRVVELLKTHK